MKRLGVALVASFATVMAISGIVLAKGEASSSSAAKVVSPKQLAAAGWDCLDPGYWVHCSPPGIDIGAAPPVIVSLNFYTHNPKAPTARFLGFEDLIRVDIWKALPRRWPCGENGAYRLVPGKSLPSPGYMYCHRFNDRIPPPPRGK